MPTVLETPAPTQCACGYVLPRLVIERWDIRPVDAGAAILLQCPTCKREHVVFRLRKDSAG